MPPHIMRIEVVTTPTSTLAPTNMESEPAPVLSASTGLAQLETPSAMEMHLAQIRHG